jgi:hypothetical protein
VLTTCVRLCTVAQRKSYARGDRTGPAPSAGEPRADAEAAREELRLRPDDDPPLLPTLNDLLAHLEVDFSEFVHELAATRQEVSPLIDLSNPEDFVLAQALLLSKQGKDVGTWLARLEQETHRLRRAEMWADRRWAEAQAKGGPNSTEPEEPEEPEPDPDGDGQE